MAVAFDRWLDPYANKANGNAVNMGFTSGIIPVGSLIVWAISSDNTSQTNPIVSSIMKEVGETNNWAQAAYVDAWSGTASTSLRTEVWYIKTTVQWNASSIIATLNNTSTAQIGLAGVFTGVGTFNRATVNTTAAATTVTVSGVTSGKLVIGYAAWESNTVPTADNDTTGGAWSTPSTAVTSGGGASNTHLTGILQYKISTSSLNQTFNPTTSTGDASFVIITFDEGVTQYSATMTVPVTSEVSLTAGSTGGGGGTQYAGTMTVAVSSTVAVASSKLTPATVTIPVVSTVVASPVKITPATISTPVVSTAVASGIKQTPATVTTPVVSAVIVNAGSQTPAIQYAGTMTVALASTVAVSAIKTAPATMSIGIVSTVVVSPTNLTPATVTIPITSAVIVDAGVQAGGGGGTQYAGTMTVAITSAVISTMTGRRIRWGAEANQPNGTQITIANSDDGGEPGLDNAQGTLATYDTFNPLFGNSSYKFDIPAAAGNHYIRTGISGLSNQTLAGRHYFILDSEAVTANNVLARVLTSGNASTIQLRMTSANVPTFLNSAASIMATGAAPLVVGNLYRWEWWVTPGTGTGDGRAHMKLFDGHDTTPILEYTSLAMNTGTAPSRKLELGRSGTAAGAYTMRADEIVIDDSIGENFIGPLAGPYSYPGSMAVDIVSNSSVAATVATPADVSTPVTTTFDVSPQLKAVASVVTPVTSAVTMTAGQTSSGTAYPATMTVPVVAASTMVAALRQPASVITPVVSTVPTLNTLAILPAAMGVGVVSTLAVNPTKLTPASFASAIVSAVVAGGTKLTSGSMTSTVVSSVNGTIGLRAAASTTTIIVSTTSVSAASRLPSSMITPIVSGVVVNASPAGASILIPIVSGVIVTPGQRLAATLTVTITSALVITPAQRMPSTVLVPITSATPAPAARLRMASTLAIVAGTGVSMSAASKMAAAVMTSVVSQFLVNATILGSNTGVYIGQDPVIAIYVGDQPVSRVYYGSELVWSE